MDQVKAKRQNLLQALETLKTSVNSFALCEKTDKSPVDYLSYDEARRVFRDSMIQRFEFCADLFWKYIKKYAETSEPVSLNSPAPVIRTAFRMGILTEHEAGQALEINESRNLTSHIYREEIAEQLAKQIPGYCQLMFAIAQRLE